MERRITHLDLKFLDLDIVSVNTKLPKLQHNHSNQHTTNINNTTNRKTNKVTRFNDETIDATIPDYENDESKAEQSGSSCNQGNSNIIAYLSGDINQIRTACSNKIKGKNNCKGMIKSEEQQKIEKRKNKEDALNRQIAKYQKAAKRISIDNDCIHRQILNLYFENQCFQSSSKINIKISNT